MFTGIIQAKGKIKTQTRIGEDMRLSIATAGLDMAQVALGDSIAVNGVCLTAIEFSDQHFAADVSLETLRLTTLGELAIGSDVNLEKALTLATPLGGHLVSGHVDGLGEIVQRFSDGRSQRFHIKAPDELARYIAKKGSICVDGISLTVNEVNGAVFELNIVPHTLHVTTMGAYQVGQKVNLEVDLIARYAERLILGDAAASAGAGISLEFLQQHGFALKEK